MSKLEALFDAVIVKIEKTNLSVGCLLLLMRDATH